MQSMCSFCVISVNEAALLARAVACPRSSPTPGAMAAASFTKDNFIMFVFFNGNYSYTENKRTATALCSDKRG